MQKLNLLTSIAYSWVRDNGNMQFSFSDEKIDELRELITKEFGEPITLEETRVMADNLLELYDLLLYIGQSSYS